MNSMKGIIPHSIHTLLFWYSLKPILLNNSRSPFKCPTLPIFYEIGPSDGIKEIVGRSLARKFIKPAVAHLIVIKLIRLFLDIEASLNIFLSLPLSPFFTVLRLQRQKCGFELFKCRPR